MNRRFAIAMCVFLVVAHGGDEDEQCADSMVSVVQCADDPSGLMRVYRAVLPAPTDEQRRDPAFQKGGPGGGPIPTYVFYAVEKRAKRPASLRWVKYVHQSRNVLPQHGFAMASVCWERDAALYIVVLDGTPSSARLMVYRVDGESLKETPPLALPPPEGKTWPVEAKPVSETKWDLGRGEEGLLARGGVANVRALADGRGILVSADVGGAPMYWRFDPSEKVWSRVHVESSP